MAELNKNKYLDLTGLQTFWNRVKEVILHSIIEVKEGIGIINEENGDLTKVTEHDNKYIKVHEVRDAITDDGGQKNIYYIDESPLVEKLNAVDANIVAEETARKEDVALLAGMNWNTSSHTWSSDPTYPNITKISERLVAHDGQISALVQATEFVGVVDWDPKKAVITADTDDNNSQIIQMFDVKVNDESKGKFRAGDIIIYGDKEYILNGDINNGPGFVELGDVTAEQARLTTIENWINNPINDDDINTVFDSNPAL